MGTFNKNVVKVNITYDAGTTETGFSIPLFVANHNVFTTRQAAYASLADVSEAGFATGSAVYQFASGVFGGKQSPDMLVVGRAVPDSYAVQVNTSAVEDDVLSVYLKLDGAATTIEYTVIDTDTTSQLLGDGLAALIASVSGVATAGSDADGKITITLDDDTLPTSFGVAQNTTVYVDSSEAPADILAAIDEEYSDYAIVCAETHEVANQELYAAYIETNDKLYIYSSQDPDAYDPLSEDDVFFKLSDAGYQYSCGMYFSTADTVFPEAALCGTFVGQTPSVNFTANLQTLVGLSTDTLSTSQRIALTAKNANYYISEYSAGAFHEGWVGNSDWLDRSRFGLWLKVRSQESMYSTLKSLANRSSAVAYSAAGISIVRTKLISDVIKVGISGGTILEGFGTDEDGSSIDYNYLVEASSRASQTSAHILSRTWTGFTIEVVYSGSIHHIDADAYVISNRTAS